MAFVHYMECVLPLDAVDEELGCVCLRWATTNEGEGDNVVGGALKENDCTVAGEWFRATPFLSILSAVHIV